MGKQPKTDHTISSGDRIALAREAGERDGERQTNDNGDLRARRMRPISEVIREVVERAHQKGRSR